MSQRSEKRSGALEISGLKVNVDVYMMGRHLGHSFVDGLGDKSSSIDYRTLELLYQDTRRKFKALGLRSAG
jgi:hypothetical protein